jgi:hypothetical protein
MKHRMKSGFTKSAIFIAHVYTAGRLASIICVALLLSSNLVSGQEPVREKPSFSITPRFNSAGHFPFTGSLINNHLNFDVNIFFQHKGNGFFIFKSHDLKDPHSIINYLQPGIFKKFKLGPCVQLGTFFGYLFSQTNGFKDSYSDYYTAAVLYWTINDNLKLENTALFFDLTQSAKLANRMLLSYKLRAFKFDLYLWQRVDWTNNMYATSASLAVNLPKIKLTDALYIQNTISYQGYLTQAKPDWAMRKGLLISVAFPITISK